MTAGPTTSSTTYLLPIKAATAPSEELTEYLRSIARRCPVVIVDGSPADVFDEAHRAWSTFATHVPPDPAHACANGKVHGVLTGLDLVSTDVVVIADDDVRYDGDSLARCVASLGDADVVHPQNHFSPLPWHARWDTARILLNRMTGGDFAGTLVVRTDALRRSGGYDGDVLFENLELMRTVVAHGGRVVARPDLFVRRLPPTARHFLGQRVRQAYDELARPERLAVFLAIVPAVVASVRLRRWSVVAAMSCGVVGVAEAGRRRDGGRGRFPASSSFLAPLWLAERGVCAWLAMVALARGGVTYSGGRLRTAAHSGHRLRAAAMASAG